MADDGLAAVRRVGNGVERGRKRRILEIQNGISALAGQSTSKNRVADFTARGNYQRRPSPRREPQQGQAKIPDNHR
jgi:hypothetical protein